MLFLDIISFFLLCLYRKLLTVLQVLLPSKQCERALDYGIEHKVLIDQMISVNVHPTYHFVLKKVCEKLLDFVCLTCRLRNISHT